MGLPMNLFYDPAEEAEKRPSEKREDSRRRHSRSTRVFREIKSQIQFIFDLKGRLEPGQRAIWGHKYKLWVSGIKKEAMRR